MERSIQVTLIDSERYLLVCSRYIELNPVRAGVVENPQTYRWSSYRHNAYGEFDTLITPHALYCALGPRAADQQMAYRALFNTHLEAPTLDAIRNATNDGTILGHGRFREQIEAALRRPVTQSTHGGDRRSEMFQRTREQA